ncbi:MAG: dihydroorotate dehydrogenase electron transfer subunit [Zhaonellaceae bacterium]|nr:dihydroorotate dehydrogenase electron transfer subunit [Clostridia bacterium]
MKLQTLGQVIRHEELSSKVYYLVLKAPQIAKQATPGQFVQVKCSDTYQPLLRKPFSLHEIDKVDGRISLLYEVKGQGTKSLTKVRVDDYLDLIGPLGSGFSLPPRCRAILVGGGMGIAPLLPLAEKLKEQGQEFAAILGFNEVQKVYRLEAFQKLGQVIVTTLDGSLGEKGLVTQPLERELGSEKYNIIYACGPEAMLKNVSAIADSFGVECQVSLEAYMACGFGACLGCVCQTKELTGPTYSRVCTDGPVFNSREVIWHEG